MWRLARGILPMRRHTSVASRSGLSGACPFCGTLERAEHIFYYCILPVALLKCLKDLYELPGIPYSIVRYLNALPSEGRRQFVLAIVDIPYQIWIA